MEQIEQAVYDTIHNSEMSTAQIAQMMGMGAQVLRNKASATNDTHKLSLLEAIAIVRITGDTSIVRAINLETEGVGKSDESKTVFSAVMDAGVNQGELLSVINESLDDGIITVRENEKCQRQIQIIIESFEQLSKSISTKSNSDSVVRMAK